MEILKRYWKFGVCPVLSIISAIYGGLDYAGVASETVNDNVPSWVWFAIGYILLWVGTILIVNRQWQEIKKIKNDPHTRWRELSKQASTIVSNIDQEINQSVAASTLPVKGFQKCIVMILEQITHVGWDRIGDTIDFTDEETTKVWVEETIKAGISQVSQKENPFLMVEGIIPKTMNKYGIGIDSISSVEYKTEHNVLRQIVKERAGTAASKAYKDYLANHNDHYSLTLLSRYLTLFYEYAETLSPELKETLQGLEAVFAVIDIMNSASLQNSLGRLDIAEANLIESMAGWAKETNKPVWWSM